MGDKSSDSGRDLGLTVKFSHQHRRRSRTATHRDHRWHHRLLRRLKEDSQFLRSTVQSVFAFLCVWIGVEFYLFVRWGTSGGNEQFIARPPGVEGFLPISALISFKYWLLTGAVTDIHPAGLFILLAIVATGLFLKKSFCSWLCPIGTLSESLWMLGKKMFGRNIHLSRWLDYPLRSIKYLLLLFFVSTIVVMDPATLRGFLESPYNKVADIKMYLFFANITSFALWSIITFLIVSLFVQNFWCRYLCPYGALLGAMSWLSPLKITRNKATCIDCELCTKACPANINVHKAAKIWSDECMSCMLCAEACPIADTLDVRTPLSNTKVPNWVFATLVVGIVIAITGVAMLTGHWHTAISQSEYLHHFRQLESSQYQH